MADVRSITTDLRSNASMKQSTVTQINKLALQLDEERKEREQMKQEIEALKKINSDLCNALLTKPEQSPIKH